jgi:hypothetical protein
MVSSNFPIAKEIMESIKSGKSLAEILGIQPAKQVRDVCKFHSSSRPKRGEQKEVA